MVQGEFHRVVAEQPGRVVAQDGLHSVDDRLPLRAVFHVSHALKQFVIFGVFVVGRVFAAACSHGNISGPEEHAVVHSLQQRILRPGGSLG